MRALPFLEQLGAKTLQVLRGFGHAAFFTWDLILALPAALRRFGLVVAQIHAVGNLSLLIILASGTAVGFVLALQMYYALVTYGATESLGLIVNLSLVREALHERGLRSGPPFREHKAGVVGRSDQRGGQQVPDAHALARFDGDAPLNRDLENSILEIVAAANRPGDYEGFSANYSGDGFSHMRFAFHGLDQSGFDQWIARVRHGGQTLDRDRYLELEKPSEKVPVMRFGAVDGMLWDAILNMCVEPGKMCMGEMMAIDKQGGLSMASVRNTMPLVYDKYAGR